MVSINEGSVGRTSHQSRRQRFRNRQGKELVRQDLVNSQPMLRVFLEQLGDEMLGGGREADMVGERIVAHLDPVVRSLDVTGLKRWPSDETGIGDNPQAPDINLVRVATVGMI